LVSACPCANSAAQIANRAVPTIAKVKAAAGDFNRLYTLSSTTKESEGALRFPISGHVVLDHVAFTYPSRPDVPILTDISFKLVPGDCVAIVGPSGSGKSTIAALLQRLYSPTEGTARMDKFDLSFADVKWLRNHIAVVSQSANLFDASVASNIAYGSDVPIGEIHRAAKAANIHDFIQSLPQGYDTHLGENASLISGGQAQRLQIARALVRRSNILILDECTSALDVDNQRAILDTIVKIKDVSGSGNGFISAGSLAVLSSPLTCHRPARLCSSHTL
jgi:ATP-binding cassette subfamily B (MDR/TAP) protein 1